MSSSSACYLGSNNIIKKLTEFGPCQAGNTTNPYVSCCATGHVCLSNGLCQYSPVPTNGSGIYTGGCTDSSLQDGSCMAFCKELSKSEVIYVDGIWQCCGTDPNNEARCNSPQGPGFSDPSPFDLTKVAVIEGSPTPTAYSLFPSGIAAITDAASVAAIGTVLPSGLTTQILVAASLATSATSAAATQASSASVSTASLTATNAASSSNTQMSSGAIAGIVLGIVGILALAGVLSWFFCIAKRRNRRNNEQNRSLSIGHPEKGTGSAPSYRTYQPGYSHGATRSAVTIASELESPLSAHPTSVPSPSSPHDNAVYEMQGAVAGRYHELDSQSHPSELMDCIRDEDRTVGGTSEKKLPSLPTSGTGPENVRSTQRSSYLGRYSHLLSRK